MLIKNLILLIALNFVISAASSAREVSHNLPKYEVSRDGDLPVGGVIIYSVVAGRPYVLLGQEQGGDGRGKWCFMLGHTDDDTTVRGAAREMHEESAGVYQIDDADLMKFPFFNGGGYHGIFVVPGTYLDVLDLNRLAHVYRAQEASAYSEMDNYVWVDLQDLRYALQTEQDRFIARTPSGSRTIELRYCASWLLTEAETRGFLAAIPNRIHADPMEANTKPFVQPGFYELNDYPSLTFIDDQGTTCRVHDSIIIESYSGSHQVRSVSQDIWSEIMEGRKSIAPNDCKYHPLFRHLFN